MCEVELPFSLLSWELKNRHRCNHRNQLCCQHQRTVPSGVPILTGFERALTLDLVISRVLTHVELLSDQLPATFTIDVEILVAPVGKI